MATNNYWLIAIDEEEVNVSLVLFAGNQFERIVTGKPKIYEPDSEESLILAVDASLSETAQMAAIEEAAEPELAAFILSPFWIDIDGQITAAKFKLIEEICKKLKFKPLGFIGNDEALVESVENDESFSNSFILINLGRRQFNLSLVYFGKVKERFHETFSDGFSPKAIENVLANLSSQSTLPPLLIFFGDTPNLPIDDIKNYPWIGKKIGDIFFHLPDLKFLSLEEITRIWASFINKQIIGPVESGSLGPTEEAVSPAEVEPAAVESLPPVESETALSMEPPAEVEPPTAVVPETTSPPVEVPMAQLDLKPKIRPKLPKIKLRLKLKLNAFLWFLSFIPLLFLGLWLLNRVEIVLLLKPLPLETTIPVTLDSQTATFSPGSRVIPAVIQSFNLKVSDKVPTTGKKTVGEKAKGSVVIFNKEEKVLNLPVGTILMTADNKQFELLTPVQVAGGNLDFNQEPAVLKLGQTKTVVGAVDIGPEFNLSQGAKLVFKDYPESVLIARTEADFTGGSRQEVQVVDRQDKIELESRLKRAVETTIKEKIEKDINNLAGALPETVRTQSKKIEFNRNVGEVIDELSAVQELTMTVFVIPSAKKDEIIYSLIETKDDQADYQQMVYQLKFTEEKSDEQRAIGQLTITGSVAPKLDLESIKSKIVGRTWSSALNYFKNNCDYFYSWKIRSNLPMIGKVFPLPIIKSRINLVSRIN
ncbi:MAG TPA: hypothetical protein P5299_00510 [Candidatus Woesebacteria bacterium]|nr:hypothetical protein [Candidatus Woesebacteria bacterium]HRT39830.1 hypothetical protein [Candidatus Woesebacteria bacterium]